MTLIARIRKSRVLATVALVALAATVGIQAPSQAAPVNGSYAHTYAGPAPYIYYPRTNYNGPTFTLPSSVPAGATITTVDVDLGMSLLGNGMYYEAYLCAGAGTSDCVNVSPEGVWKYNSGWKTSTTVFTGYPATTQFHYVYRINDGKTGSIIPALNPARYVIRQNTTVGYTYDDLS